MKKFAVLTAAAVAVVFATAAHAGGNSELHKADGTKIRIICNPVACQITFYDKAGNKVKMESADGGDYGYAVSLQKYKALGYQ